LDIEAEKSLSVKSLKCHIKGKLAGTMILLILFLSFGCSQTKETVTSPDNRLTFTDQIRNNGSSIVNYSFVIEDWRREIKIDSWGGISVADICLVTNNSNRTMTTVSFILPANASAISVQDAYGTFESASTTTGYNLIIVKYATYVKLDVILRMTLSPQQKVRLLVEYGLPSSIYLSQRGWQDYTLNFNQNKTANWFVKQFTLAVLLPEGAAYQTASITPNKVQPGLSVSVEFVETNMIQINEPNVVLQYQYLILWAALRPAIWTGTAVTIFIAVFFTRRMFGPSAEVVSAAPFSPNLLRDFINRYDDRRRLRSELETMEDQVEKGKLSRRRYRLRKSSIDDHILRLEKDLSELRKQIASTGGQYAERMRLLETAEAEIETLKKDTENADARFLRREITSEAHRKLLDEYNRMKERAENTIEETLLRLREDIH
jgi:hypothetical protein